MIGLFVDNEMRGSAAAANAFIVRTWVLVRTGVHARRHDALQPST